MSRLDATRPAVGTPALALPPKEFPSPSGVLRSFNILERPLQRRAIVSVRQSSPQPVFPQRESRERPYALADHAVAWGWPRARVVVIDDDQGQRGQSAEQRSGSHRLRAEVTREPVGRVLGIEMSRRARSSEAGSHLLCRCGLCGTIWADEDGVYDPNDSHDKLLWGRKGSISESELIPMRNRLERGRMHKAQRGELFPSVPTGYPKLSSDRVTLDPDEQVREVIRLIFDKYDELGTVWGVFPYRVRNNLRIGIRPFPGPNRGQLEWRRPTRLTVHHVLRHPIDAGA
jgi:DNA invertase Pin-like site-specific DNA recombinase